jgi:hypothetical protein
MSVCVMKDDNEESEDRVGVVNDENVFVWVTGWFSTSEN